MNFVKQDTHQETVLKWFTPVDYTHFPNFFIRNVVFQYLWQQKNSLWVLSILRVLKGHMSLCTSILKILVKRTAVPVRAIKAYSENCGLVALILNRGTRWRWVAYFTPRPSYLSEELLHSLNMKLGWTLDMVWTVWRGLKSLSPTEIRTQDFLARNLTAIFITPSRFQNRHMSSSSSSTTTTTTTTSMAPQPNADLRLLNVFLPVCPLFDQSFRFAILHLLISVCTHKVPTFHVAILTSLILFHSSCSEATI